MLTSPWTWGGSFAAFMSLASTSSFGKFIIIIMIRFSYLWQDLGVYFTELVLSIELTPQALLSGYKWQPF